MVKIFQTHFYLSKHLSLTCKLSEAALFFNFQVNYGKLLWFLKDVVSSGPPANQVDADNHRWTTLSHSKHKQRYFSLFG